jgi:hypothetical protein
MTLKTHHRRQSGREREMTAAMALNLDSAEGKAYFDATTAQSRRTAREAWKWFDKIGTVHKAVSRSARIAGYAKLRCVMVNEDGTDGDEVTDGLAADIVENIYSPYGGVRGLIDRFYSLMKIPGDSFLIRLRDGTSPDGYHFLSSDEIDNSATDLVHSQPGRPIRWNTMPMTSQNSSLIQRETAQEDALGRVWLPGRRYVDLPDSPLAALKTECEVLHNLTQSLKGRIRSRFALAGLLFIPSEIQDVIVSGRQQGSMDVLKYLTTAMRANVQNYETAEVMLPILLRGPGQAGEQIKWITIDRELLKADLELRSNLIDEILFGLDIQTGATKGTENANHWGAWAMSDEEVRIAVQPDLDILAWALTTLILHPQLEDAEMPFERIMRHRVAWDVSQSAVRTNRQDDTRKAYELGGTTLEAIRQAAGLTDGKAIPTERDEITYYAHLTKNPRFMDTSWQKWSDVDWDEAIKFATGKEPGPLPDSTGDAAAGPGVGDPGSPSGGDRDKEEKPE